MNVVRALAAGLAALSVLAAFDAASAAPIHRHHRQAERHRERGHRQRERQRERGGGSPEARGGSPIAIPDGNDVAEGATTSALGCTTPRTVSGCIAQTDVDIKGPPTLGSASGGLATKALPGLTNTAVLVQGAAAAGQVYGAICGNTNTGEGFLQFYDAASAPTVGTSVKYAVPIAASATGGIAVSLVGVQFASGIYVAATTTYGGSTALTTALDCTVFFK